MELAEKKCLETTQALEKNQIENYARQVPEWDVRDDKIERTLKFPNFVEAMKFANRITNIAEEQNHHPDLHISWGKLRIELSTHKVNGLSTNDFILAAKIDRLVDKLGLAQSI